MNNGLFERDIDDEIWMVEFEALEQLIEFCNKYGNVILRNHSFRTSDNSFYPVFEIYDDCCE